MKYHAFKNKLNDKISPEMDIDNTNTILLFHVFFFKCKAVITIQIILKLSSLYCLHFEIKICAYLWMGV